MEPTSSGGLHPGRFAIKFQYTGEPKVNFTPASGAATMVATAGGELVPGGVDTQAACSIEYGVVTFLDQFGPQAPGSQADVLFEACEAVYQVRDAKTGAELFTKPLLTLEFPELVPFAWPGTEPSPR